ncbi:MAG: GGDEF domain-containing protein [Chloroflexi bacterium]|nr:GGDEF domain-containing protein [Chloroflexota bacterium]
MSSDQITYVLVALLVTGVAILLLLAGVLLARRGRGARPAAWTAPAEAAAVAAPVAVAGPPAAVEVRPASLPAPAALDAAPSGPAATAHAEGVVPAEETIVTAADREAAARRVHDPREQEIIEGFLSISPRRREAAAYDAPREPAASVPIAVGPGEGRAGAVPADPYVDDVTGLESRAAWDRVLADENARYVRYRRPVGVVVAELDGLARFEGQFGAEAGHRVLAAVGGAMRRGARRTDRVAHVGEGRFLVLMPETDEIQAINYVERVRGECERWLDAGAVALRLAMGWASPSAVGELDTALRAAEERMYAERRRTARGGVPGPDAAN